MVHFLSRCQMSVGALGWLIGGDWHTAVCKRALALNVNGQAQGFAAPRRLHPANEARNCSPPP